MSVFPPQNALRNQDSCMRMNCFYLTFLENKVTSVHLCKECLFLGKGNHTLYYSFLLETQC
jgi:hypothetical protein